MLTKRQEQLFTDILEGYIKTSEPVGSKVLATSKRWKVSSATLRNEMCVLEKEGLIMQPHTSAGRIPTEKGYQHYRNLHISSHPLNKMLAHSLEESYTEHSEEGLKSLARELASISHLAVLVGFGSQDLYYTGIRHLIEQFDSEDDVHEVIATLDEQAEEIALFLASLPGKTAVVIGNENPILSGCSIIVAPVGTNEQQQYIGILGPMRMEYGKMISLIHRCSHLITE